MLKRSRSARRVLCPLFALLLLCLTSAVALAREPRIEKDIAYGAAGETKLLLDIYHPEGFTGKRPAIVMVHGGGWSGGDKSFYAPMGKMLAEKGYVAFSINYRLVPAARYPAQVDDVQRAVRWVRAHAADYNLDPKRLGALGDSAGGHLVAMLGTRNTRDNGDKELAKYSSRVQCVVDLYGPTDFTLPTSSAVSSAALQILTNFFGKTREQDSQIYRDGSPIVYVNKKSAPFLIMHGTADNLVPIDQSQRMRDALQKAGVEVTFVAMEKDGHGFLRPENQKKARTLIGEFFAKHLKP